MRFVSLLAVLALAACDITSNPTGAPDPEDPAQEPADPDRPRTPMYALEDVVLLSGGTGILVSESFDRLVLVPAEGEDPAAPRRYTNFVLRVDGAAVDAVQLDEQRVEFDVPALPGGPVAIEFFSSLGEGSVSAQVVGLVASGHTPCALDAGSPPVTFTPVGREVYFQVPCLTRDSSTIVDAGIARLLPDIVQREFSRLPESIVPGDDPALRRDRIAVGPSSVAGQFIGPYPTDGALPPMIWRWQAGQSPGAVGAIDCGLPNSFTSGAVAESGDGTCVALDLDRDALLRAGAVIADAHGASSIVASVDGWLALRGGTSLIIIDAAGQVVVDGGGGAGSSAYEAVRFSSDGQALFVGREGQIEVIERGTGAVLRSAALPGTPLAIAVTETRLYLAIDEPEPSGTGRRLVVALYDPGTLELVRKIAVSRDLATDAAGWPDQGESPLLLEDATGTRVLLVTQASEASGIHVHAVEGL